MTASNPFDNDFPNTETFEYPYTHVLPECEHNLNGPCRVCGPPPHMPCAVCAPEPHSDGGNDLGPVLNGMVLAMWAHYGEDDSPDGAP